MAERRFVWCGLERCEERDASGSVVKRFFGQGAQSGTRNRFYQRDHLGSIRQVTEQDGSVSMQFDYTPWGEQSVKSGTDPIDFGYTGHYTGTGFTIAPYRLYNPQIGRWISRDPMEEKGGMAMGKTSAFYFQH